MVRSRCDRGAVTVEFAVALPVIAIVVTLAIAGVLLVDTQGRLQLAAATASRALGRGDAETGQAALAALGADASSAVSRHGHLVCVTVERRPGGPLPVVLRGAACAADGGG
ncbi:TadE/TadG family type IV pilus assembly protein [Microbacterium sp. M1A1_1b]|uniref:TadE/TadG family type IV pilus assembly protein n=1 Tax=Curtobacterium sp. VKM Ac-2922 TaxID=2929475 RepID=UPI001FB4446A|nr:TadE family type IV pilus minor pilin [Curtobacterium sp. VKM Ac-2922]MCJ1713448.1 pilus assembly protein [Curtobacterium sp. VKM Ac-2922]